MLSKTFAYAGLAVVAIHHHMACLALRCAAVGAVHFVPFVPLLLSPWLLARFLRMKNVYFHHL